MLPPIFLSTASVSNIEAVTFTQDTKTQGHKDMGTQRHRDTKTQGHKGTGTQRHGDKKTQAHKDTGTQSQGHKDKYTDTWQDCQKRCLNIKGAIL